MVETSIVYSIHFDVANDTNNGDVCYDECHQEQEETNASNKNEMCRYYLSPSSIPNSGWGIFTAVDIAKGETVFQPDVVISLVDMDRHNGMVFSSMFDSYVWEGDDFAVSFEADLVDTFLPGPGAIPNFHPFLKNVIVTDDATYDDCDLHRSKDPGAGAFTYYNYDKASAVVDIASGTELFVDYGQDWLRERSDTLGMIPLGKDYKIVDVMMGRFLNLKSQNTDFLSKSALHDLWDLTQKISSKDPRTINAFKITSGSNIEEIYSIGTARFSLPFSQTNITLMEDNGLCVDYLKPRLSNIPQAGKGAFATRSFIKGDIIAPAPLIHIINKTVFEMYDLDDMKSNDGSDGNKIGKQLLVNYCYTHRLSTVLLCPYGSAVNFINHDSVSPNVEIRWSNFTGTQNNWLKNSVEDLQKHSKTGLMFEFVALRNISSDEEVVLDYGREWEKAWDKHMREFSPSNESNNYMAASRFSNEKVIRTQEEQRSNPYPDNIITSCKYDNVWNKRELEFEGEIFERSFLQETDERSKLRPCLIISRDTLDGKDFYTAIMLNGRGIRVGNEIPLGQIHRITNIPRNAIELKDDAYSSDFHLKNTFRHSIGIPDKIFPSAWINLK